MTVELGEAGAPPSLGRVIEVVYSTLDELAVRSHGVSFEAEDRLGESFALLPAGFRGPGLRCVQEALADRERLVGLRYDGPVGADGPGGGRIEVLLHERPGGEGGPALVRMSVRWEGDAAARSEPAPPLLAVARRFGLRTGGTRLPEVPVRAPEEAVQSELLPLLQDAGRSAPVVVVSPWPTTGRPWADVERLQRALLGLAPVYVLETTRATYPLAETLGRSMACFDGAVRIYFPGVGPGTPPSAHPLWRPAEQADEEDFPAAVRERVLRGTPAPSSDDVLSWDLLTDRSFRRKLDGIEDARALALMREREEELTERIHRLEAELEAERHRAASLAGDVEALRARLRQLEPEPEPEGASPAVRDAEAVVREVVARHPDRLVLALNSRSRLSGYPFEDLEGLEAALEFLAGEYWESRFEGRSCPDPDLALRRKASGFSYQAHQSRSTVGRYPEDYVTTWKGRAYELFHHIGKGRHRDTRISVRIAFAVDEERRVLVIGFFGQHQRTGET